MDYRETKRLLQEEKGGLRQVRWIGCVRYKILVDEAQMNSWRS